MAERQGFMGAESFPQAKTRYTENDNPEFIYKDLLIKVKSQNKKIR